MMKVLVLFYIIGACGVVAFSPPPTRAGLL